MRYVSQLKLSRLLGLTLQHNSRLGRALLSGLYPLHDGRAHLAKNAIPARWALYLQHKGQLLLGQGVPTLDALEDDATDALTARHLILSLEYSSLATEGIKLFYSISYSCGKKTTHPNDGRAQDIVE